MKHTYQNTKTGDKEYASSISQVLTCWHINKLAGTQTDGLTKINPQDLT